MVYVDNMNRSYGRYKLSHMMADTLDELHSMADKIGVKRKWFQGDHYDICMSKKTIAISLGAIQVNTRFLVKLRNGATTTN